MLNSIHGENGHALHNGHFVNNYILHSLYSAVDDCDLYVLHFKEFGKEFAKSQNISPDVFVQLALQLTYYK